MKITYFGTTTLMFDDGRDQVMFDCHVTRPSMPRYLFGRLKTDGALAEALIRRHRIDRLRAIFISHTHHDHVMDAPFFARKCASRIYGSVSALNVGRGGMLPEGQLRLFGNPDLVGRFEITAIPSLHSAPKIFNNDLGRTIDAPLIQPARARDYREGGSYDFLVRHRTRSYLIRPSFNCIVGQLDGLQVDALFLGISGMSKARSNVLSRFFEETIDKVRPGLVVPIHWDNFFYPLDRPVRGMPRFIDDTGESLRRLAAHCARRGIHCLVQPPLSSIEV